MINSAVSESKFRQSTGLKILTPQGLEVGQIKEIDGGESNMTFPLEMDVRIKVRDSRETKNSTHQVRLLVNGILLQSF